MTRSSIPKSILPTPPKRRYRSFKSRDKKGRRLLGSVYARHLPERHQLIDMAEFFRYVRQSDGDAIARAVVVAYKEALTSSPHMFSGKLVRLYFPDWNHLGYEAQWYFYLRALVDNGLPITHAITINFSDTETHRRYLCDQGPGNAVGELVRTLEPIYRRAEDAKARIYAYTIEIHRKPDDDWGRRRRQNFESFDATLLLNIPNKILKQSKQGDPVTFYDRVSETLATWAGIDVEQITRRNSGTPLHIQPVGNHRRFARGGDNTLRAGIEGIGDYAAKTFTKLHNLREFYREHDAPFAEALEKINHASAGVREHARAIYEQWHQFSQSTWDDVAMELGSKRGHIPSGDHIEVGQPIRIGASDEKLQAAMDRFRTEADVKTHLATLGL